MNSLFVCIPFALVIVSIAILPIINKKWWHKTYPRLYLTTALIAASVMMFIDRHALMHTTMEYISFITLLASLFIISGGIVLKENLKVSAVVNSIVLIIGAVIANIIGTTGASMLLIRPLIRLNKERKNNTHLIVFFIFIVANIGGSLTPLGDPPLFLGFLKGVPFFWTLKMFPAWLLNNAILITIFFVIDSYLLKKENFKFKKNIHKISLKVFGIRNIFFIFGVIASMLIYASLPDNLNYIYKSLIQITMMAGMALLSWIYTPTKYRQDNHFDWQPIKEVAILFSAIFATMIPVLQLLSIRGGELNITKPYQFFWITGVLSSFLDNAPTYLSMLSLSQSISTPSYNLPTNSSLLFAISMGAVFMGANTYIGNGPNFMIKSISDESGIKTPSFFAYMLWTLIILVPLFILDTFVFFL